MSTVSSSGTLPVTKIATRKPWFLTYNPDAKDVLIWKNGIRLKIQGGSTSGRVTAVSVLSPVEKTVTLKGLLKDGSREFRFHCYLSAFEKESNDFTKQLSPYINDPHLFCVQLEKETAKTVVNESTAPSQKPSTSHKGRKRESTSKPQGTASKKKKPLSEEGEESTDKLQSEITEHQIGVYTLPVASLRDPPPYLKVRDVKDWYVEYLANMLTAEEGDHEDLTAPLLVIASVTKADFQEEHIHSYTYEVIGGIQRFTAITKINSCKKGRTISTRKCAVYSSGLSRPAALVLARQHNEFNQIQRTTSFPELAASCRRLLFAHFATGDEEDDGETLLDVPRYNAAAYKPFKQECLRFLVSSNVSQPMVEQAIQMAILPGPVYHKMQSAFTLFEEGKLKGQKPRQMTGITLQKAMEGKLAPKLSQFKVFQGLQDEDKERFLDGLLAGELSFTEVEKQSAGLKTISTTKEAFLKQTGLETWEEAQAKVPEYAKDEELRKFSVQKGKALPRAFTVFCQKARNEHNSQDQMDDTPVMHIGTEGNIEVVAVNPAKLIALKFGETDMVVMDMRNVLSMEELDVAVQCISMDIRQRSWTLVLHNITNGMEVGNVEETCHKHGAGHSRVVTVCFISKAEGEVQLGSSKEVVVAWWGTGAAPKGHILAEQEVNTIVCHPEEENTMAADSPTGWLGYMIKHATQVADLYGGSGEVAQVCKAMVMPCLCVQATEEAARSVIDILGFTHNISQDHSSAGNDAENTEALISNIMEAEKLAGGTGDSEATAPESTEELMRDLSEAEKLGDPDGVARKTLGASARLTRSKGGVGNWSKSLNPDKPML